MTLSTSDKALEKHLDRQELLSNGYIRNTINEYQITCIIPAVIIQLINQFCSSKHINIAFLGHIHSGKSTIIGRLLTEIGHISNEELDAVTKCAEELGKSSYRYAFICDKSMDDRNRGTTIFGSTHSCFTHRYHSTMYDCPGSHNFIKNTIKQSCAADAIVLVISAVMKEFEASIAMSSKLYEIIGGCRQHAILAYSLGIRQLIVVVNKMDHESVDYNQQIFEDIKEQVQHMLQEIGFDTNCIPFIPISGLHGLNVSMKNEMHMQWWKGFNIHSNNSVRTINGITLLEAIDSTVTLPDRKVRLPFRMSISDAFTKDNDDHIFSGHIIQGHIEIEQQVRFAICGREGITKSIFMHNKSMLIAEAGDLIGIRIEFNADADDKLLFVENESEYERGRRLRIFHKRMRGEILYAIDADVNRMISVPRVVKQFTAKIHVLRCRCIRRGSQPIIYIKNNKCACKLVDINWVVRDGNNNNNEKILLPSEIRTGDEAEIVMQPLNPLVVCTFEECEAFSRIIAVNSNMFLFYGHAISVEVQDCK